MSKAASQSSRASEKPAASSPGRGRMGTELRRDIVRRVEGGEKSNQIAWELGFSSAAVYRLMRNYRARGEAAFYTKAGAVIPDDEAPARPRFQMPERYIAYLRGTLTKYSPADLGIAEAYTDPGKWSAPEVKALLKREHNVEFSHDECARVQHLIGLRSHLRQASSFKDWQSELTDEFLGWRKSAEAKKLTQREQARLGAESPSALGVAPRGRVFDEDRAWRNAVEHYSLQDRALPQATAQGLAKTLLEIQSSGVARGSTSKRKSSKS